MAVVKTSLIKIGNSIGLRIPRTILQQLRLTREVELEIRQNQLVIKSAVNPRAGWDEDFRSAGAESGETFAEWDVLSLAEDRSDWQW